MTQQKLGLLACALYRSVYGAPCFTAVSAIMRKFTIGKEPLRGCRTWRHGAGHFLLTSSSFHCLADASGVLATLVVLFSAGAGYYMTFLNVVIGCGIIASVDHRYHDLSKEVVGLLRIA